MIDTLNDTLCVLAGFIADNGTLCIIGLLFACLLFVSCFRGNKRN